MRAWSMIAGAVLVACGGEDPITIPGVDQPVRATVGEPFVLGIGGEARLEDGELVLELLRIVEDSRCPVDPEVACPWEGNAAFDLRVTTGDASTEVRLQTAQGREAPADGFVVVLEAVEPEAREGVRIRPADYRLTLRVARLQGPSG